MTSHSDSRAAPLPDLGGLLLGDAPFFSMEGDMRETCTWSQSEEGWWETECDNAYAINEGLPSENEMKFCCYCGKPLVEVLLGEEE